MTLLTQCPMHKNGVYFCSALEFLSGQTSLIKKNHFSAALFIEFVIFFFKFTKKNVANLWLYQLWGFPILFRFLKLFIKWNFKNVKVKNTNYTNIPSQIIFPEIPKKIKIRWLKILIHYYSTLGSSKFSISLDNFFRGICFIKLKF